MKIHLILAINGLFWTNSLVNLGNTIMIFFQMLDPYKNTFRLGPNSFKIEISITVFAC